MHDITIPGRRQNEAPAPANPDGTSPDTDRRPREDPSGSGPTWLPGLIGPVLASAAAGVQLVLAGVLLVKLPEPDTAELTQWGRSFFIEDRDLPIFGASVAAAFALMLLLMRFWNRRTRSRRPGRGSAPAWLGLKAAVAIGGTALFLNRWTAAREFVREGDPVPLGYLLLFGFITAVTVGVALLGGRAAAPGGDPAAAPPPRIGPKLSPLDLLVPMVIVVLVYVPEWRQLSGRFFLDESLFHWDFYSMSPTIAWHHGRALGAEVYSMYGVGWPMVFDALGAWMPISYGRMIQVGSIYSCIYLTGVYLLFRLLVRRLLVAALGALLVLSQLYLYMDSVNIWRFPSLTVMRWAFDVWCLVALVVHHRSGKRIWAAAAGVFIGLALLFSTDTGLYLAAAVTFYLLATLPLNSGKGRHWIDAGVTVASAAAVFVAGLAVAARGQLFTGEFLTGWLQALLEFGGGFAQLPMATVPNLVTVAAFAVLMLFYLAVIGYALGKLMLRRAGHFDVFNAFVAVYGLLNLMHFVGRSGDYTPYRLWIPMAIIVVLLADRALDGAPAQRMLAGRRRLVVPALAALAMVVVVLVAPPALMLEPVRSYPNLFSLAVNGSRPDGLCLLEEPKDLCGLPEEMAGTVNHFRLIADRLEGLAADGKRVAVVDETGALFYLASDTQSFSRYPRIFIAMYDYEKADEVRDELLAARADYILTRTRTEPPNFDVEDWPWTSFGIAPASPHDESWGILNEVIRERYEPASEDLQPFELWQAKAPSGS